MFSAMAMMMGGMPTGGYSAPRQKPQRKLSIEEEAKELENRKVKFTAELERCNSERKSNFKKFKEFEVYGLKIIAFNSKNAMRDMNSLMRSNLIQIQQDVQVQG